MKRNNSSSHVDVILETSSLNSNKELRKTLKKGFSLYMSCLTLNSVQPFTETRANYTTKKNLFNSLSANPTKWSNTLKQFFGNFPTDCLSVLDHFVGLMLNRSSPYETSLMELFHKNSYGSLLLTSFTKSSLKHAQQRHITFNILWKLLIKNSEKLQKILSF